ncbi:hypothetical protein [Catellatospora chokoriensis]|uniref:Uncharacterized protein n=1 Tax=Catellatospora chokoriensis TaxID=310353 RepID=A0A8J3NSV4_9ACTN|nr:hypothetical protein [Catellatospora chokoriensis]GIF91390.1 hypothetical protein Cch02nite_48340 [Catellatospora chokoriensis]
MSVATAHAGAVVGGDVPPPRSDGSPTKAKFRPSRDGEARILLLIDEFSRTPKGMPRHLEGRVKLAKLDFLLRYPRHLHRVLEGRNAKSKDLATIDITDAPLDSRMMRYRYGPWDHSYYAILGSLIGRGLVVVSPLGSSTALGYRTTEAGAILAAGLRSDEAFHQIVARLYLLKKYLDKQGTTLKSYLYQLPEVADAEWHEELT